MPRTLRTSPEAEIQSATIGELGPHASSIVLAEYDEEWPRLYQHEEARIRATHGTERLT